MVTTYNRLPEYDTVHVRDIVNMNYLFFGRWTRCLHSLEKCTAHHHLSLFTLPWVLMESEWINRHCRNTPSQTWRYFKCIWYKSTKQELHTTTKWVLLFVLHIEYPNCQSRFAMEDVMYPAILLMSNYHNKTPRPPSHPSMALIQFWIIVDCVLVVYLNMYL